MLRTYWYMRRREHYPQLLQLERRPRRASKDPNERQRKPSLASPQHLEYLPFPYNGLATGLDTYIGEGVELGLLEPEDASELDRAVRQELMMEAYEELAGRAELQEEFRLARELHARIGF